MSELFSRWLKEIELIMDHEAHRAPKIALRMLEGFEAAARTGSFSKAADALGVSRSAISHQIRELELTLGAALFIRRAGSVTLTAAGSLLAKDVAEGLGIIRKGMVNVRQAAASGTVSLSAPPFFAAQYLGETPARGFRLKLIVENRHIDFSRSTLDAAVRFGEGRWPGLKAEPLLRLRFTPVCAPHLAETPAAVSRVLETAPRLSFFGEGDAWEMLERSLRIRRPASAITIQHESFVGALQACVAGHGVMVAPIEMMGLYFASGQLKAVANSTFESSHSFYFVAPPAKFDQPAVAALRKWLSRRVRVAA